MKDFPWLSQIRQERISNSARNPGLAALMSFFIMGLGQIYAGHVDRGIVLLVIQLTGVFGTYGIYTKGILFDALLNLLSPLVLMMVFYFCFVGLILLWIFNIKDAYYLALFSSFRDWFEIERTVIPLFSNYKVPLLPEPKFSSEDDDSIEIQKISDIPNELEEEILAPIRKKKSSKKRRAAGVVPEGKREIQPEFRTESPLFRPDVNFNLKFYGALGAILLTLGAILFNLMNGKLEKSAGPISIDREVSFAPKNQADSAKTDTKETIETIETSAILPVPEPKNEILAGMALIKQGAFASGAARIEEGLKTNEAKPMVWRTLLSVYKELERMDDYERVIKKYLENYQVDPEGWMSLGKVYYDRRDYVEASRAFSRALGIFPNHPLGNFYMGAMYRELGIPEDAIPCFERALLTDPLNSEFLRELGAAYLDSKNFKNARKFLFKAISVSPDDEAARGLLAQVESLISEDEETRELASVVVNRSRSVNVPQFFLPSESIINTTGRKVENGDKRDAQATVLYDSGESLSFDNLLGDVTLKPTKFSAQPVTIVPSPKINKEIEAFSKIYSAPEKPVLEENNFDPAGGFIKLPPPNKIEETSPRDNEQITKPVLDDSLGNAVAVDKPPKLIERSPPPPGVPSFEASDPNARSHTFSEVPTFKPLEPVTDLTGKPQPTLDTSSLKILEPEIVEKQEPPEPLAKSTPKPQIPNTSSKVFTTESVDIAGENRLKTEGTPKVSSQKLGGNRKALEGAKPPTAGDEPREFFAKDGIMSRSPGGARATTSRGEGGRVPPFVEKLAPKDKLEALFEAGRQKYLMGKWEKALPDFLEYLMYHEDPEAYEFAANAFDKLGMHGDAMDAVLRANEMGKKTLKNDIRIGQLAEKAKRYQEGIPFLQNAVKKLPHRIDLKFILVTCLKHTARENEAKEILFDISKNASGTYSIQRRVETELESLKSSGNN